jgi:two-component system, OmpR family, response regulator
MRILLVEDDSKIASFVIKGLREAGFAVDHAVDGEDGLHMALYEPYDAAVIDIMLPKLDGLMSHREAEGSGAQHAGNHIEREKIRGRSG